MDDKLIELGDPETTEVVTTNEEGITTEVVTTNVRERLKALLRTKSKAPV